MNKLDNVLEIMMEHELDSKSENMLLDCLKELQLEQELVSKLVLLLVLQWECMRATEWGTSLESWWDR